MATPFEVISNEKINLTDFLPEYWRVRLGQHEGPCPPIVGRIGEKATIGEQIPDYRFRYNDVIIYRRSFRGIDEDICGKNDVITTDEPLEVRKGEEVYVVVGSSIFTEKNSGQLVREELDAVRAGHLSVRVDGVEKVPANIDSLRVGPIPFDLAVNGKNSVADRMEYPLEKGGTYVGTNTGGHCLVLDVDDAAEGEHHLSVNFDGVRGYSNRVNAVLKVI